MNRPLESAQRDGRAGSRVGWTSLPLTPDDSSLRGEHPIRTLTRRVWSRAGRVGILVFHAIAGSLNDDRLPVMHQPVDQGRGQGVVHVEQGAPFPEGSIRGEHDRSGFITGSDHLEQQIGPALVDRQIAQLIEEEKTGTGIGLQRLAQKTVDLSRGEMIDHVDHARVANRDSHAQPPCSPTQ